MAKTECFCYLRVSSNRQLDGTGLDCQLQVVKKYARQNKYKIVEVFREEAVSGTKNIDERPAFQAMMGEILSNGINTVIVEGLDRLAREYRIQETLAVYLASKGVNLISARTRENITEAIEGDPLRKALVQIQGIIFELEKNTALMRMRKGKERARAEGRRAEGQHRYGEDSPEEQAVIKRIKLMRRRRKGGYKGLTFQAIADKLNAEGIKTKKGRNWTPQLVHHVCTKL